MSDRTEMAEFTNMCMVQNEKGEYLVLNKVNSSWNGLCFPGGHVEKNESFVESVVREVYEETGLTVKNPRLCGIKQGRWSCGARYVVLFYKASEYSGEIHPSDEGEVFWCSREDMKKYTPAGGFDKMFEVFTRDDLTEVYYYQDNGEWKTALK